MGAEIALADGLSLHVLPLHFAGFAVGGSCAVVGFLQTAMWFGHA
jgi:hypothetical protein